MRQRRPLSDRPSRRTWDETAILWFVSVLGAAVGLVVLAWIGLMVWALVFWQ